jgi:hypothetical protein
MGKASKAGLCAVNRASNYLGVTEHPAGSNLGPRIDEWNTGAGVPLGSPWCMSFQHAMFLKCGVTLGGWASVGNFLAWADQHGYEVVRPFRGDLVCYDWNGDNWPDHVEIVARVLSLRWKQGRFVGLVRTVGGNTGDAVRVKVRLIRSTWKFVRIPSP